MGDPRAAQVLAFSKQGMSDPEIGKKMGLHKVTVWKLRNWGTTASFSPGSKTKAAAAYKSKGTASKSAPRALPPVEKAPATSGSKPIAGKVDKVALAIKLHKEGLSDREVGQKLGVSRQRAWKLRNWGGAHHKPKKASQKPVSKAKAVSVVSPETRLALIKRLHKEGLSDREIGLKLGMTRTWIQKLRTQKKGSPPKKGKASPVRTFTANAATNMVKSVKLSDMLNKSIARNAAAVREVKELLSRDPVEAMRNEFDADQFRGDVRIWLKDLVLKEFDQIKASVMESMEFDLV